MDKQLSKYFEGVLWKTLSSVEADPKTSNQHEFNGVAGLRNLFGTEKVRVTARFIYLCDEDDISSVNGFLTWYNARENHPQRSEYRLYYSESSVMKRAGEGDLVVITRRSNADEYQVAVIVAKKGSTYEHQVAWLFGLDTCSEKSQFKLIDDSSDRSIGIAERRILEELGVIVPTVDEHSIENVLSDFGYTFPSTRELSAYARQNVDVASTDDPDLALLTWMEREESLFQAIERYKVKDRITEGFSTVDDFLKFSLSVHNRRKSRAGFALENHVEQIFKDHQLVYTRNGVTENKSKPDFLFPEITAYHTVDFPASLLTMLGVKSTCKDRWRQVLSEATRIEYKHLLTLETGISEHQTNEMQEKKLQLVVPAPLHVTYRSAQQQWLMSLQDFIHLVASRQTFYHAFTSAPPKL